MKDEYSKKIEDFLIRDISDINELKILEFGVRHGITTKKFLKICEEKNGQLFSIDIDDCSSVSKSPNWTFIKSRDDNFDYIEKKIPKVFDVILIDSFHNAKHVKKILYYYYRKLKIGGRIFIDDICWIPYVLNNYRNHFNSEMNNRETFDMINKVILSNQENINVYFSFVGSGMAKIIKLNENKLSNTVKIKSREFSLKNIVRKLVKR